MLPTPSRPDGVNILPTDAKHFSDISRPDITHGPYLPHVILVQYCIAVTFTPHATTALHHVSGVVELTALFEMGRIVAQAVIALVSHDTFRLASVSLLECDTMDVDSLAAQSLTSIPVAGGTSPLRALAPNKGTHPLRSCRSRRSCRWFLHRLGSSPDESRSGSCIPAWQSTA